MPSLALRTSSFYRGVHLWQEPHSHWQSSLSKYWGEKSQHLRDLKSAGLLPTLIPFSSTLLLKIRFSWFSLSIFYLDYPEIDLDKRWHESQIRKKYTYSKTNKPEIANDLRAEIWTQIFLLPDWCLNHCYTNLFVHYMAWQLSQVPKTR